MKNKQAILGKNGSSQVLYHLTAHSKLVIFFRLRKSEESHISQEGRKISSFLRSSIVLCLIGSPLPCTLFPCTAHRKHYSLKNKLEKTVLLQFIEYYAIATSSINAHKVIQISERIWEGLEKWFFRRDHLSKRNISQSPWF